MHGDGRKIIQMDLITKGYVMLKDKKLFLFDIDGTIAIGDTLYEGSRELLEYIESIGGKAYYITNNSTKSNEDYVKKFKKCFGLETTENQFITSGFMTKYFLKDNYCDKKIFVVGTDSYVEDLRSSGLQVTTEVEADIALVVVAYDSELNYEKLTKVSQVLFEKDVPFYATNPDLRCPIDFGFIPDCGAICNMITATTDKTPIYLGKPNKKVVEMCLADSGFLKEETIVVGDRLYTDIACGIQAGVDTCVVFTGEAQKEDMLDTPYKATYEFDDIKSLLDAILGEK